VNVHGRWSWSGSTLRTNALGFLSRRVTAARGSLVRIWSPRDRSYSWPIVAR
jgi:hypothetical protein